jgi:hypothetical protein
MVVVGQADGVETALSGGLDHLRHGIGGTGRGRGRVEMEVDNELAGPRPGIFFRGRAFRLRSGAAGRRLCGPGTNRLPLKLFRRGAHRVGALQKEVGKMAAGVPAEALMDPRPDPVIEQKALGLPQKLQRPGTVRGRPAQPAAGNPVDLKLRQTDLEIEFERIDRIIENPVDGQGRTIEAGDVDKLAAHEL